MEENDTVELLAFIAAFDQRTVGKMDVKAWTLALPDVPWDETTQEAVVVFYAGNGREEHRFMQPHDLRAARKRIRADRLERVTPPPPNWARGVSYLEEYRALRRAIGDGVIGEQRDAEAYTAWGGSLHLAYRDDRLPELSLVVPLQLQQRPVLELMASVGKSVERAEKAAESDGERPGVDPATQQRALSVECPWRACRAPAGEPCVGAMGKIRPHPSRVESAERDEVD